MLITKKKKKKSRHLRIILDAKRLLLESGIRMWERMFGPVQVAVAQIAAFADSGCMWPHFPFSHSGKYSSDWPR